MTRPTPQDPIIADLVAMARRAQLSRRRVLQGAGIGAGALAHGPLHQTGVARLRRLERRGAAPELVGGRRHGFAQLLDLGPQRRRAALGPGRDPAAGARRQDYERGDQRRARGRTDGHGGTSRTWGRNALTSAPPHARCSGSSTQVGRRDRQVERVVRPESTNAGSAGQVRVTRRPSTAPWGSAMTVP